MLLETFMFLTIFAAPPVPTDTASAVALIDSLYFAGDPAASLAQCEAGITRGDDAQLRWRAARAAIALGMLEPEGGERKMLYDRALLHARRGVHAAPNDLQARYWVAAAAGRRAHRDDPVLSAKLAMEVYEQASLILAADSSHAGAHHALGMLHAEVLRAPKLIRMLAGRVLRMDVASRATHRDAERHLKRAVELEPEMVQYMADLAGFYLRTRRHLAAQEMARRLETTPARHPMDRAIRYGVIGPILEPLSLASPE